MASPFSLLSSEHRLALIQRCCAAFISEHFYQVMQIRPFTVKKKAIIKLRTIDALPQYLALLSSNIKTVWLSEGEWSSLSHHLSINLRYVRVKIHVLLVVVSKALSQAWRCNEGAFSYHIWGFLTTRSSCTLFFLPFFCNLYPILCHCFLGSFSLFPACMKDELQPFL